MKNLFFILIFVVIVLFTTLFYVCNKMHNNDNGLSEGLKQMHEKMVRANKHVRAYIRLEASIYAYKEKTNSWPKNKSELLNFFNNALEYTYYTKSVERNGIFTEEGKVFAELKAQDFDFKVIQELNDDIIYNIYLLGDIKENVKFKAKNLNTMDPWDVIRIVSK